MNFRMMASQIADVKIFGSSDPEIDAVCYDSRAVREGSLFAALRGEVTDGHKYIEKAILKGASAILAEEAPTDGGNRVPWLLSGNSRIAMAEAAIAIQGNPSASLKVAGITGTNGKTTTGFLVHHLMNAALRRCGLLGTVKYDVGGEVVAATRTTPESSDLQAMLGQMVANGCGAAVMEVSSHAMLQARVHGVQYDTAVFTNLSQDHLDYHKTMEDYFQAKRLLFQQSIELSGDQRPTLVINVDDRYGVRLADEFEGRAEVIGFGMGARADFRASKQNNNFDGTTFELTARGRQFLVQFPLIGDFNIYNALAALAVVSSLGVNLREAIQHLGECPQVPGRLESVAETVPFRVFVDYAHTPDALKNALQTLRDLQPQRLITVFGCGGDRDRDKRPAMGKTADELSDFCVVTSDNPRSENPTDILERIKVGMPSGRYVLIEDRREAIRTAINSAKDGDIVLVAGKGHEPYQEVANETIDFDDRQVARNFTRDWRPPADPS